MTFIDAAVVDRFKAKINMLGNGCWLWTGSIHRSGYGHFKMGGSLWKAHRAAWELFVGPIPDGMTIDHICRVRECVNPTHLRPLTLRDNILCSGNPAAINAAKTHCKNGHELSGDNVQAYRTYRRCIACDLQRRSDPEFKARRAAYDKRRRARHTKEASDAR